MPPGGWEFAAAPVVTFGVVNKLVEVLLLGILVYFSVRGEPAGRGTPTGPRAD